MKRSDFVARLVVAFVGARAELSRGDVSNATNRANETADAFASSGGVFEEEEKADAWNPPVINPRAAPTVDANRDARIVDAGAFDELTDAADRLQVYNARGGLGLDVHGALDRLAVARRAFG